MKRLFIFLALFLSLGSCETIESFFEPPVIKEEVTPENEIMVCIVSSLIVRHKPTAPSRQKDGPKYKKGSLDLNDEVTYLGEKSNLEERSYAASFPIKPKREDYWYKVRFKVKRGKYAGATWIGWVHGGGMKFKPQQQLVASENKSNQPERYAVLVGISNYSDLMNNQGARDLHYCDDDVNSLFEFLRSPAGGSVPEEHISKLLDENATVENILAKCNAIYAMAGQKAIIIFYFSGHGSENQFIAYDGVLHHSDIKSIVKISVASRKLIIADACYSGSIIANIATSEGDDDTPKDEYGIAFFMSSKSNQTSIETAGHGVFTNSVIKGLTNCNANKNGDGIIDIEELSDFVKEDMKDEQGQTPRTGGTFNHQMPIISCNSNDIFD
jgi:hypothetical protein